MFWKKFQQNIFAQRVVLQWWSIQSQILLPHMGCWAKNESLVCLCKYFPTMLLGAKRGGGGGDCKMRELLLVALLCVCNMLSCEIQTNCVRLGILKHPLSRTSAFQCESGRFEQNPNSFCITQRSCDIPKNATWFQAEENTQLLGAISTQFICSKSWTPPFQDAEASPPPGWHYFTHRIHIFTHI